MDNCCGGNNIDTQVYTFKQNSFLYQKGECSHVGNMEIELQRKWAVGENAFVFRFSITPYFSTANTANAIRLVSDF